MAESRRKYYFPDVTDEQWNDWHWQVLNRIETLDQLKKYVTLTAEEEEGVKESLKVLRMAITPYYLSLIDPENPNCPIRKQAIPTHQELVRAPEDQVDPLSEDEDSPVPGLTHRYPDRVLFLITDKCSMYCRHCTRRRFAGQKDASSPSERIDRCIDYIANTPTVRDVLLSGGDALLVSDERLEYILKRLREIPHVEIVRIGSRTPVVLPQRITPQLVDMLKKYHPVWLNTHFNHPNEVTEDYVSGAVGDNLLEQLRLSDDKICLIIRDFTRMFALPEAVDRFLQSKHEIKSLYGGKLLAVTINPVAPSGYKLKSEVLRREMEKALGIPVYDVRGLNTLEC